MPIDQDRYVGAGPDVLKEAGRILIADTVTLAPGEQARVDNIGTDIMPVLRFGVPKGDVGPQGPVGANSWATITGKPTTTAGLGTTDTVATQAPGSTAPGNVATFADATGKVIKDKAATVVLEATGATSAVLGAELVANGSFTSDTGWTKGTGWSITGGSAVLDATTPSPGTLSTTIAVESGASYYIEWDQTLSAGNMGSITPSVGSATGGAASFYTTTLRKESQVITSVASGPVALSFTPTIVTASGTITIDNVTVKKITPSAADVHVKNSASVIAVSARGTNIFIGGGLSRTSGNGNVGVGSGAQQSLTTGNSNVGVGSGAQQSLTTGTSNVGVGLQAQQSLTTGNGNVGVGSGAQQSLTTGNSNVGMGLQAQQSLTTGGSNVGVGQQAQQNLTTGNSNVGVGLQAQQSLTTGGSNVGVGQQAQQSLTTGSGNVAMGQRSGSYRGASTDPLTTSNNGTYIGTQARASADGVSDETVIGRDAIGSGSNTVTLGNASLLTVVTQGQLKSQRSYNLTTASSPNLNIDTDGSIRRSTSSDRYKAQVETLEPQYADAMIMDARPVWYRSTSQGDNPEHSWYGLVAEEVAAIDPRLVHWGHPLREQVIIPAREASDGVEASAAIIAMVPDTTQEPIPDGVQYDRITVMLMDVVRRQGERIDALELRLAAIERPAKTEDKELIA